MPFIISQQVYLYFKPKQLDFPLTPKKAKKCWAQSGPIFFAPRMRCPEHFNFTQYKLAEWGLKIRSVVEVSNHDFKNYC